jgi:hypothetical protein
VDPDLFLGQKCAGSNSPGASGSSASFCRKHEALHFQTCQLAPDVSTLTLHGSTAVVSTSRLQKLRGSNLMVTPSIAVRRVRRLLHLAWKEEIDPAVEVSGRGMTVT